MVHENYVKLSNTPQLIFKTTQITGRDCQIFTLTQVILPAFLGKIPLYSGYNVELMQMSLSHRTTV